MVTVTATHGSTPRKVGARMVVGPGGEIVGTIGGAELEKLAIEKALQCLTSGRIERLDLDLDDLEHTQTGMACGGRMELLIEPFGVGPRLLLFGAGHVAKSTGSLAAEVGFSVVVLDARPEWANQDRFPRATIEIGPTEDLADQLDSTHDDFIAVMTHSHDQDYKVLTRILRKPFFYLGVIGSERKAAEIRHRLADDGFTEEEVARMTCPIGLDIGSHTPVEIAVSMVAQLIAVRSRREKERAD